MAANMTNYLESLATLSANGNGTIPQLAQVYLRFHTADCTETGAVAPLGSGGGYNVQGILTTWADLAAGSINVDAFSLSNAPAATITHWTVWDGTTNVWFWGTYAKTFSATKDYEWDAGDFTIAPQGNMTDWFKQKIADGFRNVGSYINANPKLLAWSTTPPTDGTVGANECDDANYARAAPAGWGSESGGVQSTNADTLLGTAFAATKTVSHMGILDDDETPDKVCYWIAPSGGSISMDIGDILRVKSGDLTVTAT
jgi:hypothetical protein